MKSGNKMKLKIELYILIFKYKIIKKTNDIRNS